MDQKELRTLEYGCIQEEPPYCTAACPIHVDVRTFTGKMASGAWDEAWKILARTMPVPEILARICDHPCERMCKRSEAGGAIAVAKLERACVAQDHARITLLVAPKKDFRVAIVGAGVSGLVVAWDLVHKGYGVTVFDANDDPGVAFRTFPEQVLPHAVVDEQIAAVEAMGAEIRTGAAVTQEGWLEQLIRDVDAVYIALDAEQAQRLGDAEDGELVVDPITLASATEGVFVGGGKHALRSLIGQAADGRRAAISIDRFIQKVSMTAARESEGPVATRLYTNMKDVRQEPPTVKSRAEGVYTDEEAMREAGRCIRCECLECVKNCLYLERFKSYPRRYFREIYNNETIVLGSHSRANKLLNHCSLCGLCGVLCPSGVSMADVCLEGRRDLVQRGKMPPSFHDFALEDMAFNNSNHFAITLKEPGAQSIRYMFFPGCQLAASSPAHVEQTYDYLRRHLFGGVGLMFRCCGAPALWAGRAALFDDAIEALRTEWAAAGKPTMVFACPTCYRTVKEHLPDVAIVSLWEFLDGIAAPLPVHPPKTATVHDPCTSRREGAMQESVRKLLARLGYGLATIDLERDKTECCGYGGLMSTVDRALAADVAKGRAGKAPEWVTYCAMCRDALAGAGAKVVHILDLIFQGPDAWKAAGQKGPGYSERHENRARLREKMLAEVSDEGAREMEGYEKVRLHISDRVRERMEERRILVEDVQKVIDHAETTGSKIFSTKTEHWLASYKPRSVTYWVEYTRSAEGYTVHKAYSHRMQIINDR